MKRKQKFAKNIMHTAMTYYNKENGKKFCCIYLCKSHLNY